MDLLGGFPAVRADLDPIILETTDCGTYLRNRIELTTFAALRMPIYVLIPKQNKGKLPAVIACHGHGYGSKEIIGLNSDGSERREATYQKDFALECVKRGYVTVVPELLGFGDRKLTEDQEALNSCNRISTFLLMMGQTMAGHRLRSYAMC